ncbi:hypothetical protein [Paenibacillus rigui]|uniref:DUF4367 domain-containing protein n=1 Tax=Paenibacillus rigui TaxID=554312 RepID=A0A229UIW5_9BACL|nr:hypothetical protein [Paenibacillus rigui]OXM83301.1 hypothetical protein CF651_26610 [Paenibacillus rigui]
MTEYKKNEQEFTDAAWSRLQEKLAQEPRHEQWSRWSQQHPDAAAPLLTTAPSVVTAAGLPAAESNLTGLSAGPDTAPAAKRGAAFGGWLTKHKKWVSGAAAAIVLTAVIATPAGNEALASILNKFRMQQLTVVQENDLQAILNGAFEDGKEREAINKFGTFTQTSGKAFGEMTTEEAAKKLGHKLFIPKEFNTKDRSIYVSPSQTITFKMNVDEVNKAMTRLGAKKLLPASVDGKPITLETGEAIHLYVQSDPDSKRSPGYSLSQLPVPTITVDPSIKVAEALDAVLQFPMLPQSLKESLQTANVLNGGAVPMPVIANGQTEKTKVEGVEVIVTTMEYGHGQDKMLSATWIDHGQLLRLDGSNALTDRQALLAKVSELIKS